VEAFPLLADCSADSPEFCRTAITKYKREHGVDVNYHQTWDRFTHPSYCGLAYINDYWGATYEGCTVKTAIHEIGHNFGLRHSNLPDEEYGDKSGIMGKSSAITGLLAPNLVSLQLYDDRTRTKVDETCQLLLAPIELNVQALHHNEHQIVTVYSAGHSPYYLSLRKAKGWPYIYNRSRAERLFVHTKTGEGKTILMDEMRPGDTALQLNNTKIEYLEYSGETARVNIIINPSDPIIEQDWPTGFPAPVNSAQTAEHHTGLWYDPDFTGQGFDVQVRDGRMSLIWYTFNEGESSRRFYIASGDIDHTLELYTTVGGTFADPIDRITAKAGECRMDFLNERSAVFHYNMEEFGRGAIELELLAPSQHPDNGLWYQPDRAGEGFSIQFQDAGARCSAYWYTYGVNPYLPTSPHYKKNCTQRWFMCLGDRGDTGLCDLTIYEVRGGWWMDFEPIDVVEVGEAVLAPDDNGKLDFIYTIDADESVTGTGSLSLTRLL
jgi:hypothetical protein